MKKRFHSSSSLFAFAGLFLAGIAASAVPARAAAAVDRQPAAGVTTVEIISGEKTVATLEVSAGDRLNVRSGQQAAITEQRDGASTTATVTLTGNVVIEVMREGKSILRIRTEKAIIRTTKGDAAAGAVGNPVDVTAVPQTLAVMGAVGWPGQIAYVPGMTLAQAVAKVGGSTNGALLDRVVLVRVGPDGKATTRRYNLADPKDAATPVQPRDFIKVPFRRTGPPRMWMLQPVPDDRVPPPDTAAAPMTPVIRR
jgi:polysaccharide export outer membrane protein